MSDKIVRNTLQNSEKILFNLNIILLQAALIDLKSILSSRAEIKNAILLVKMQ